MLNHKTSNHFNSIASTWEKKEWINSTHLNTNIDRFIKSSERQIGLQRKQYKSSLYFGIGTGVLFRYLKRYNLAGVDKSYNLLNKCPEGIIQILSDVKELPFLLDNQFHLTFSRNLIKHCEEPLEAIQSMYNKTRPGCLTIAAESVVLKKEDKDIPTKLVRMTDSSHPSFKSIDEIINLFKKVGYKNIDYKIVPHRSSWLKKWIEAEQASEEIHQEILNIYNSANDAFKRRHNVIIKDKEITSTVPWLLIRAIK